jgi:integrase
LDLHAKLLANRSENARRQLVPDNPTSANHRSAEFCRRCRVAGISGVSLHSSRHAWAQRANACAYPQRFAQEALGHNNCAVHEAYARGALVILPPLDDYEKIQSSRILKLVPEQPKFAIS